MRCNSCINYPIINSEVRSYNLFIYLTKGIPDNHEIVVVNFVRVFMGKIFSIIYYIYNENIYKGDLHKIHASNYAKQHAIGVFAFLQLCNIVTIDNFFKTCFLLQIPIVFSVSFSMVIYFLNYYFFKGFVLIKKPHMSEIFGVIAYAVISILFLC